MYCFLFKSKKNCTFLLTLFVLVWVRCQFQSNNQEKSSRNFWFFCIVFFAPVKKRYNTHNSDAKTLESCISMFTFIFLFVFSLSVSNLCFSLDLYIDHEGERRRKLSFVFVWAVMNRWPVSDVPCLLTNKLQYAPAHLLAWQKITCLHFRLSCD